MRGKAAATPSSTAVASAAPADSFGPALDRQSLTEPRKRRGGPPSTYDLAAFCRVLRDGIDPAHVMIPSTMPRYVLSQDECAALWEYVTSP